MAKDFRRQGLSIAARPMPNATYAIGNINFAVSQQAFGTVVSFFCLRQGNADETSMLTALLPVQ